MPRGSPLRRLSGARYVPSRRRGRSRRERGHEVRGPPPRESDRFGGPAGGLLERLAFPPLSLTGATLGAEDLPPLVVGLPAGRGRAGPGAQVESSSTRRLLM